MLRDARPKTTGIDYYYVGKKYMYEIYKRANGEIEVQVYFRPGYFYEQGKPHDARMVTNAFWLTLKQVKDYIKDKEQQI